MAKFAILEQYFCKSQLTDLTSCVIRSEVFPMKFQTVRSNDFLSALNRDNRKSQIIDLLTVHFGDSVYICTHYITLNEMEYDSSTCYSCMRIVIQKYFFL